MCLCCTPSGRANFHFLVLKILFDNYDLHIFNLTSINSLFCFAIFGSFLRFLHFKFS